MSRKKIKLGVIGVSRGQSFMVDSNEILDMELVAICDTWKDKLEKIGAKYGVATYTDYDRFLEHDMDAVVLANYFHEHAPFAVKALEAGKHVMSETASNATLAEGVELCRAVEKSGLIYMLAENYPYMIFNQEMERVYKKGEIGDVTYAEGEYNHPMSPEYRLKLAPGKYHWRSWRPSTYYCTHALAPLMYITKTMPIKVNSLSIADGKLDEMTVRRWDPGSVILCRMNNGSVFRLFGLSLPGHSCRYRLHGSRGAMETRGGKIRIWHEEWDLKSGESHDRTYAPEWSEHGELARAAGHGGGDFWTNYHFANAIRSGNQPYLDVYRGVTMSSVGILAWKSALEDGVPFEMPDFSNEESRKKYENDNWSPWPKGPGDGQAPSSILGFVEPTEEAMANAYKIWKDIGYDGE